MKKIVKFAFVFFVCFFCTGCVKKKERASLEAKDYAVNMEIDAGEITFDVADLTDYAGDNGASLKTKHYSFEAESLEAAQTAYYEEQERAIDLGHLEKIKITDSNIQRSEDYFYELSKMPEVPKSVEVSINGKKDTLREFIRALYDGDLFNETYYAQ